MVKILGANKKKNLTFEIHEGATTAFKFFISMEKLFNIEKLPTSSTEFFVKSMTLHAIENNTVIQIISGFEHNAFDLTKTDFSSINILIYSPELSENDISELAWSGVIEKIHSSIDMKSLGHFMNQSNTKIPTELMKTLYGSAHLSEPKLAELASICRGTIANQRTAIREENEASESISKDDILSEMRLELL
ncbi:hypothetical protein JI57_04075 [Psychromonas sp. PRT-SC03]|nr:hypothetical protein JI57_04100 [Psychromonas sp. PRT-SC03]KPU82450.1 hypothetical protein JI57_04075 [Psychromonas sp. PRT-SC03]